MIEFISDQSKINIGLRLNLLTNNLLQIAIWFVNSEMKSKFSLDLNIGTYCRCMVGFKMKKNYTLSLNMPQEANFTNYLKNRYLLFLNNNKPNSRFDESTASKYIYQIA
jgi:hypothetical protein